MSPYAQVDLQQTPAKIEIPRNYNVVGDFIDRHIDEGRGGRTALIDDAGSYSYSDLQQRVNRAGNLLRNLGAGMETRVMACLLDGVDFPSVFFGAMKIGAVALPINTLLTTHDYEFMLRDSRAKILVVSKALFEKFEPILSQLPHLEKVIISGGEVEGYETLSSLMEGVSSELETADTTCDDIAFWLYTSGSTGTPKGAMHLQSDMVNTAVLYGEGVLGIQPDDVVFSAAKMFFAYGLGNSISFPFYVGATSVVMAERPTPDSVLRVLKQHQPTIFCGVPTLYGAINGSADYGRSDGSENLRICISAGEALPEEVAMEWERRFGCAILDGLGSTEMLHIFLSNREGDVHYGTSGVAVPGYELKIVDEGDKPVGVGEIGELLVSGPSSATAYWNNRSKSINTFNGSWTRTGDKYTLDEEGYYHYCGRTDDMLKVSGIWVSPFEVESALLAHDKVMEAAVVGKEDDKGLIKPKGFVVLKESQGASAALVGELQAFVKERLAPYKYPRWIEFIDDLPKTATGKIQRYKLRCETRQ